MLGSPGYLILRRTIFELKDAGQLTRSVWAVSSRRFVREPRTVLQEIEHTVWGWTLGRPITIVRTRSRRSSTGPGQAISSQPKMSGAVSACSRRGNGLSERPQAGGHTTSRALTTEADRDDQHGRGRRKAALWQVTPLCTLAEM